MLKKNLNRGEGNHLAPGASLLGEGNSPLDFAHHLRATPLDTKRKEIQGDLQYQSNAISKSREQSTAAKRRNKDVRPL